MKRLLKQVVGIDVAQKELVVSIGRMHDDLAPEIFGHHSFANAPKGFERPQSTNKPEPAMGSFLLLKETCKMLGKYH